MRIANKRQTSALIFILAFALLSTTAYSKPFTNAFEGGLTQINSFFVNEGYKPYSVAIDFFFFALLFIAVYMIGARYAFKEMKGAERSIVILLGLMTAFLLVLGGFSATVLLPYIHWLFYILLFMLYWWMLKGIKSKFWRFILALLLTLLTIALLQGLFDALSPPEIGATSSGLGDFFKSLEGSFKGIELPGISAPGIPDYMKDILGVPTAPTPTVPGTLPPITTPTPGPTPGPAPAPTPEKEKFPPWVWILLIIPLLLGGGLLLRRVRKGKEKPGEEVEKEKEGEGIDEIIKYLKETIEIKNRVLTKIQDLIKKKENDVDDLYDLYLKAIKEDAAYLVDPDNPVHKNFIKQRQDIKDLILLEINLEKDLHKLMQRENEILGKEFISEVFGRIKYKPGKIWKWTYILLKHFISKSIDLTEEINKRKEVPITFMDKLGSNIDKLQLSKEYDNLPEWHKNVLKRIFRILAILSSAPIPMGFREILHPAKGLCNLVRRNIAYYFLIGKKESEIEKNWEFLIRDKSLEKYMVKRGKWIDIAKGLEVNNPATLKKKFEEEKEFFEKIFKPLLISQIKHMLWLIKYIEYLKSKDEATEMQEPWVKYMHPEKGEVTLTKQEAEEVINNTPTNPIPFNTPFTILARIRKGVSPLNCECYINKRPLLNENGTQAVKPITIGEGELAHPQIEWASNEFNRTLLPGKYDIIIYLKSTQRTTMKWWDAKKITIYIEGVSQVTPTQKLTLRITNPSPTLPIANRSLTIGNPIQGLQADILDESGTPHAIGTLNTIRFLGPLRLIWYINQGDIFRTIAISNVSGPINSRPISRIFVSAPAKLGAELIDGNDRHIAHAIPVDINLVEPSPTGPPEPAITVEPTPPTTLTPTTPASTPSLFVNIKNIPKGPFQTGKPIKGLQAEVFDNEGNIIRLKTLDKVFLAWYLTRTGMPRPIPITGLEKGDCTSKPIPDYFAPGTAQLGVALVDKNKEQQQIIGRDEITINLESSATSSMRINLIRNLTQEEKNEILRLWKETEGKRETKEIVRVSGEAIKEIETFEKELSVPPMRIKLIRSRLKEESRSITSRVKELGTLIRKRIGHKPSKENQELTKYYEEIDEWDRRREEELAKGIEGEVIEVTPIKKPDAQSMPMQPPQETDYKKRILKEGGTDERTIEERKRGGKRTFFEE